MVTSDDELTYARNSKSNDIGIQAAWAGGSDGCSSVTNSLIQLLPEILSSRGKYILLLHRERGETMFELCYFVKIIVEIKIFYI